MPGPTLRICAETTGCPRPAYKLLALVMLFVGCMAAYTFVWDLGDVGIGLMTLFNMVALFPLSGEALASLREYERLIKARRKKEP